MPDDVDARDLDPEVRQELRSLARDTADLAARHLVLTGRLLDDDPQAALAHARAAGALAGRIGPVREAVGLAAYAAGEWAEALAELRTARRISGRADHLAVQADCERALGRPERALAVLDDPDVPRLEQSARVELVIVVAGARRDLGQADAAVLLLQGPARATTARRPWATRLWYAFADALLSAGREDEAREWFSKAAEQDGQGETDAIERLLELDGVVLEDLQDDDEADDEPEAEPVDLEALLAAPVPSSGLEVTEPSRPRTRLPRSRLFRTRLPRTRLLPASHRTRPRTCCWARPWTSRWTMLRTRPGTCRLSRWPRTRRPTSSAPGRRTSRRPRRRRPRRRRPRPWCRRSGRRVPRRCSRTASRRSRPSSPPRTCRWSASLRPRTSPTALLMTDPATRMHTASTDRPHTTRAAQRWVVHTRPGRPQSAATSFRRLPQAAGSVLPAAVGPEPGGRRGCRQAQSVSRAGVVHAGHSGGCRTRCRTRGRPTRATGRAHPCRAGGGGACRCVRAARRPRGRAAGAARPDPGDAQRGRPGRPGRGARQERTLPSGDVLATWRLVVDRPRDARPLPAGVRGSSVDTLNCVAWRAGARRTARGLAAGDVVQVAGALRRRFWRAGGGPVSLCEVEVTTLTRLARAAPVERRPRAR